MYQRLSRLHVVRSALALALLAGFLATPLGIAHAFDAAPVQCDALLLVQDPEGPGVEPSGTRNGHGHCFTCHWFQSLRSALVAELLAVPDAGASRPFSADVPTGIAASASLPAGARAPPA
ncbi:MAG: hypothetical protein R6V57_19315 [Vicinamibacterales bacterium]